MNYMTELKLFYEWLETHPLSAASIALWHALMSIANRSGWNTTLKIPYSLLALRTGLSRTTLYREREKLRRAGRIAFRSNGGSACCTYRLISLEQQTIPQIETQPETQVGTQTVSNEDFVSHIAFQNGAHYKLNSFTEKEKTNKKEKDGEGRQERKSCAKKRETKRLNVAQFLASLDEPWRGLMASWLEYKRTKRESYRSEIGVKKCLTMLRNLSCGDPSVAAAIIDQSIANNWAGLFPLRSGAQPQRIGQILQPSSEERERQLLDKFSRK